MSNFFNKLAIITKVNIIFFISILTIFAYTALEVNHNYQIYKNAEKVEKESTVSLLVVSLIHELQKERGLSSVYVSSGDSRFFKELELQTQTTDEKMIELSERASLFENTLSLLNLNMIKSMRDRVKKRTVKNDEVLKFYSNINEKMLQVIFRIFQHSPNEKIFKNFVGYLTFLYAKEYLGIQRAVVVDILAKNHMEYEEKEKLIGLIEKQQVYMEKFLHNADDEAKKSMII